MREINFDGLVGPTHNYGGLSYGNVASQRSGGALSNPRAAALQGVQKMRLVSGLGVGQAVLPPQMRPSLRTLRRLGFCGSDEEVLAQAARDEHLLRLCSSASAMWTANAATVAPSCDAEDRRLHLVPANLSAMFHRAIEVETSAMLRAIFADPGRFVVHDPLPPGAHFADEGAANHLRLAVPGRPAVHLLCWGRSSYQPLGGPSRYPARQTREASQALGRLHRLPAAQTLFPQQHPAGIDAGAFHSDVLAVGNERFLMLHELAFSTWPGLERELRALLGDELHIELATDRELPVEVAVRCYPFNSQVLTLPGGAMAILAPADSEADPQARAFLERIPRAGGPVRQVHFVDLRQSMNNGGGPACLRLRVPLSSDEEAALSGRVRCDEALFSELEAFIARRYRDRLAPEDLADPAMLRECMTTLDELTRILRLGSLYDFQR